MQRRYSQEQKEALMLAHKSSGLSKQKFCKQNNLPPTTFKNWFYPARHKAKKETNAFTQVKTLPQINSLTSIPANTSSVRVRVPSGVMIEFPTDTSPQTVKSLFTILGIFQC